MYLAHRICCWYAWSIAVSFATASPSIFTVRITAVNLSYPSRVLLFQSNSHLTIWYFFLAVPLSCCFTISMVGVSAAFPYGVLSLFPLLRPSLHNHELALVFYTNFACRSFLQFWSFLNPDFQSYGRRFAVSHHFNFASYTPYLGIWKMFLD